MFVQTNNWFKIIKLIQEKGQKSVNQIQLLGEKKTLALYNSIKEKEEKNTYDKMQ